MKGTTMIKWIGLALVGVALVAVAIFFFVAPARVDASRNQVLAHEAGEISAHAKELHEGLRVADLHSDMLLWARDPLKRNNRGHTDIPRLREGGYALQVFSAVTKSPANLNYDENDASSDNITPLAIAQRWPRRTWGSIAERALHQAARLHKAEEGSGGQLKIIHTQNDLAAALDGGALAGILATEGAHPLEGKIENLDRLYEAGYRILGLQHFFDNELGGSLHGESGAGLTPFGRQAVNAALSRGMIIDVAHSSETAVRDVLALTSKPVIVSHTGLKGHCNSARNISDGLIKEIAAAGGLIGVGFWDGAVCDPSPKSIAGAIVYAIGLVGINHVALGSDFDGTVTTAFDASGIIALTDALINAGLDDLAIAAVMGENQIRFMAEHLPEN